MAKSIVFIDSEIGIDDKRAAQAAVDGKSLLAVFPTGGGKSITFQLSALMAGQAEYGISEII